MSTAFCGDQVGCVVSIPHKGLPSTELVPILLLEGVEVPLYSYLIARMDSQFAGSSPRGRFALLRVVRLRQADPGATPELTAVRLRVTGEARGPPSAGEFTLAEAELLDVFEEDQNGLRSLGPSLIPRSGSGVYRAGPRALEALMGRRSSPVRIGTLRGTDVPVDLDAEDLLRHMIVIGTTGTGKSWFRGLLMEELHDLGVPQLNFDPAGEYVEAVRELGGVNVIPGRNFFPRLDSLTPDLFLALAGDRLPTGFQRVIARSGFEEFLEDARRGRVRGRGLEAYARSPEEGYDPLDLLEYMERAAERYNARRDTRENVLGRVEEMIAEIGIFGRGFAGDLEGRTLADLLTREGLVNVVVLGLSDAQLQAVMASLIGEAVRLREAGAVRPLIISFDEAHRVVPRVPRGSEPPPAARLVRSLIRYGRHLGIGIVVITQFPDSVDVEAVRLPATRVVFAVDVDQVGAIRGLLSDLPEGVRDMLPKLERGTAFVTGVRDVMRYTAYVEISSERRTPHGGRTPRLVGG
ncbi:MAG: ATP-binding protein [Candidatus Korarchaeota archaeon]|nr:ATP-binding protein [Candidatus Korarchaeota archaeon]